MSLKLLLDNWRSSRAEVEEAKDNETVQRFCVLSGIKQVCEEKKINQSELARRIHVTKMYISDIFRGQRLLPFELAEKIVKELDK